ncbi:uncharacterized protein BDR25DRAFT_378324 [Lindgomyces ingoldianus]|uniref:Uncharacterized protein n=1 Tax=Lindgomyces ingoldianus TaxID=673940 RepID=A0ACB6QFK8_9PLEO|nr:uncharacterized protein BDR25DRAFT_378324 [Lindgomyces ingoldianus]KAF2465677.1 hypothetical protein BDR25DRAFT_378324 [Lindgomyces ingoldianus]
MSGSLVISRIPQKISGDLPSNIRYHRTTETHGFGYVLAQTRFITPYEAAFPNESMSSGQALLYHIGKLKVIVAIFPGPSNPTIVAKQIAGIDNYTNGRIPLTFSCLGTANGTFGGDFYQFRNYPLRGLNELKPSALHTRKPNLHEATTDIKERTKKFRRENEVRFVVNAFVIVRDSKEEANRFLQEIQGKADEEATDAFRDAVHQAGANTANKKGIFKTTLKRTKDQIAERISLLKRLGVSLILTLFLHYDRRLRGSGRMFFHY